MGFNAVIHCSMYVQYLKFSYAYLKINRIIFIFICYFNYLFFIYLFTYFYLLILI